jgi:hypothetical protein
MKAWPALIVAPLIALTSISLGYALVGHACEVQKPWLLHAFTLVCLALALGCTGLAWANLRRPPTYQFVSLVATLNGAFFSLVIAAQWLTQLMLPPCLH